MRRFYAILVVLMALTIALPLYSCSDEGQENGPKSSSSPEESPGSAQDQAAELAAQTQLRNAQAAQETYYAENQVYASSVGQLKTVDEKLSPKIEVTSGDRNGYEISIVASDSAQTRFIIRKTGSRIERVDNNGRSW